MFGDCSEEAQLNDESRGIKNVSFHITNNDQSIYLFLSSLQCIKIIFTDILTFEWINKIKKKKEIQHRDDDDVDEMHLRVDEM